MNLTVDPWIPAVRPDGSTGLFSLQDLFAGAHEIRDLALKPHERIAVMRLLICIVQAALDGPADENVWKKCEPLLQPKVRDYLEKWSGCFELFGGGHRFSQLLNLSSIKQSDGESRATKLDIALATGNNPTLFDNDAGEDRLVIGARAALNLITFQCFAPGGRIGVAKWNGTETAGKGSSNHAPCTPSSMIHTIIMGVTLAATIRLNLLTRITAADNFPAGFGKPIWEMPVSKAGDVEAIRNATMTYLGRLIPLSRAIRMADDGGSIILANGLDYPIFPAFREATATVVQRKEALGLLPASIGRSIWRQLSAITVKRRTMADQTAGPLALNNIPNGENVMIWTGALITDKAKIGDVVEASYMLPAEMLTEFGRMAYEKGVKHAEEVEGLLRKAVGAYASELKISSPAFDRARYHFWTQIEQSLSALFEVAQKLTPPDQLATSDWGRAVYGAARNAYEQSCPHKTSRQIQAFALGLRWFNVPAKSKKA